MNEQTGFAVILGHIEHFRLVELIAVLGEHPFAALILNLRIVRRSLRRSARIGGGGSGSSSSGTLRWRHDNRRMTFLNKTKFKYEISKLL